MRRSHHAHHRHRQRQASLPECHLQLPAHATGECRRCTKIVIIVHHMSDNTNGILYKYSETLGRKKDFEKHLTRVPRVVLPSLPSRVLRSFTTSNNSTYARLNDKSGTFRKTPHTPPSCRCDVETRMHTYMHVCMYIHVLYIPGLHSAIFVMCACVHLTGL